MKNPDSSGLGKPVSSLEYLEQPCEDGIKQEQSNVPDCHPDTESLTPTKSIKTRKAKTTTSKSKSSCTPGSPATNKKTTLKDKKPTLKKNTVKKEKKIVSPTFTILHPDSISKGEALSRFWIQSKKEKYEQLSWLPKIDWQGLDSNSSNGYAVNTAQKSWFSITTVQHQPKNLEQTSSPSFKFTVANGTAVGDTIPKKLKKTLKLRLYPTKAQKQILDKWASGSRYTYNKTLATLNNPRDKCRNWMKLRNRYVTLKRNNKYINTFFNNKKWLLDTPKSVRLSAVKEVIKNRKACFTKKKKGNINTFFLRFKSRKKELKEGWSIGIEKNNVFKEDNKLSIFPDFLGDIKYGRTKQLHKLIPGDKPAADPRIQKDAFGDYYMNVVLEVNIKKPPKVHTNVRSYDPGCKIYLAGYSPCGKADIIGKGCDDKVLEFLYELDDLYSLKSSSGSDPGLNKKIIQVRKRLFNYKKELRHQVNNFVVKSSTLILYPKLDTQKLTLKETRQLRTKTVRQMLNLGHCTAYEQLKFKCLEHGCKLLTVSEAYTTKTCPCCGELQACNNDRIYKCPCGYKAERDLNGAQNILLRSIR